MLKYSAMQLPRYYTFSYSLPALILLLLQFYTPCQPD